MTTGTLILAGGLACLTFLGTGTWRSPEAVWTQAASIAPQAPRPWMNLAGVHLQHGDLQGALWLLEDADALSRDQPPMERAWAEDWIAATRAVIYLRQGRLLAARDLIAHAPPFSAREEICQQFLTVCHLPPF
jgi:hypothetical protein